MTVIRKRSKLPRGAGGALLRGRVAAYQKRESEGNQRNMYLACSLSSSSPPGRRIISLGVKERFSSLAAVVRCPASAFDTSNGEEVASLQALRGGNVETITMRESKSEGRLHAMSHDRKRGAEVQQGIKRLPVLLVDVMGTIVRDPFHVDMPAFFGLTFKELLASKHPTAWIEFEKGLLTEEEFSMKFFNDRRDYDYEGLKHCMVNGYEYLEGMEALLQRLKAAGIDMHMFSNYPTWYTMIEDKLGLSQYLPWTFVSCHTGLRKPSQEAFQDAAEWLGVRPSDCIFIDDQPRNIEAALNAGMTAIQFQNSRVLEKELAVRGISVEPLVRAQ